MGIARWSYQIRLGRCAAGKRCARTSKRRVPEMRVWIVFPIAVMMLSAESVPAAKKDAKPKAAAVAAAKVTKIPDGAVQIDASSYRYTAPDGKSRLYVKTPFGIMTADEQPMAPAAASDHSNDGVKATLDGDTIRFERPSPFG